MDENYDYEEVVSLKTDYTNNHDFLKDYDKNLKKNTTMTLCVVCPFFVHLPHLVNLVFKNEWT